MKQFRYSTSGLWFKGNGLVHWDAALKVNPDTLALAVDDTHLVPEHPGWNGGWIVVNTDACSPRKIIEAIHTGNFYSSCGPEIHSVAWDGNDVHLTTSPVRFVRLVGPDYRGVRRGSFDGGLITEVRITVPTDWEYSYVEIEDDTGRRAWTNALFTDAAN